jgi:hypothetical protein
MTDRIVPDSIFLSFRSILQENLPHSQSYPLVRFGLSLFRSTNHLLSLYSQHGFPLPVNSTKA